MNTLPYCADHGCLPLHTYNLATGKGTWSCVSCKRPLTAEEIKGLALSQEQRRLTIEPKS